jgi:hypothetical protein
VRVIQWFFQDRKSWGRQNLKKFTSSISKEQDQGRSREKEIPILMLAFAMTMVCSLLSPNRWISHLRTGIKLRAELKLWDRGSRVTIKFDADTYSTIYDHHVEVLNQPRAKSLIKFHWLVAYLYEEGNQATKSTAQGDEGVASGFGILDLDGMAE